MCIPPIVARQRLSKHVPAATNTCINRIVGSVIFYAVRVLWKDSLGSVYPLPWLGNNSVKTFPRQRRRAGGVVLYKLNKFQRTPLVILCTTLWSTLVSLVRAFFFHLVIRSFYMASIRRLSNKFQCFFFCGKMYFLLLVFTLMYPAFEKSQITICWEAAWEVPFFDLSNTNHRP
jgi:hypothetical protein